MMVVLGREARDPSIPRRDDPKRSPDRHAGQGETGPSGPVSARAMTLREYGLVAQTTDWLTFAIAVMMVPALVQVEVGPIGLVLQTGGVLGTLAFKAAGLAVVYAFLSYARPMGQFIGLTAVVVVGLIGTAGNLWALAQVTRLI
jgi:hypothetical protein